MACHPNPNPTKSWRRSTKKRPLWAKTLRPEGASGKPKPKPKTVTQTQNQNSMHSLPSLPDDLIRKIMQYVHISLAHRLLRWHMRHSVPAPLYSHEVSWVRQRRGPFILDCVNPARNDCGCDVPTNALCSECKIALCGQCVERGCMCGDL